MLADYVRESNSWNQICPLHFPHCLFLLPPTILWCFSAPQVLTRSSTVLPYCVAAGPSSIDLSVCRHGPFGHHPGWMGHWRQRAPMTLRFLLLEWNAKSGCAVDPIILASEGDAYIPGRIRPLTHDSRELRLRIIPSWSLPLKIWDHRGSLLKGVSHIQEAFLSSPFPL